jgi:uncharacterized protein (TIGR03790 family)
MTRALTLLACLLAAPVYAADAQRAADYRAATAVLYNANLPASKALAEYYAKQREIPTANLVGLACSADETITRATFKTEIEQPLQAQFEARKWWEIKPSKEGRLCVKTNIRVLALMQGLPLRITEEAPGIDPATGQPKVVAPMQQNCASVDSELFTLGLLDKPIGGPINNPFYKSTQQFSAASITPIFLVGRIDGPDAASARRLIDDALAVEPRGLYGKTYIDLARKTDGGYKEGEDWLVNIARLCEITGRPVVMDTWATTFPKNYPMEDCALYFGWYTEEADGPFLSPEFKFRRGAIATHIHSFSATTIRSATSKWCGPLLAKGACGVLGNTWEPYLALCANLDLFVERLQRGFTLSEAAWASTRAGSWMSVVLGDPLYRPFAAPISTADKTQPDYKALRLGMQSWGGPENKNELLKNLGGAGESLHSGTIFEFLGLHAQADAKKAAAAAAPWFAKATTHYSSPNDRIRIALLRADAHRRDGDLTEAASVLRNIIKAHPRALSVEAAKVWLQEMSTSP